MIRVGLIGCGVMAASHVRALEPLRDRMRFTGFADIDLPRAQAAAKAAGAARAVTDFGELFDTVDAVVVALPHDLHYPVGRACLEAGKHVLMEKPLAVNEAECRALVAADTSPEPVLMLGYIMRHDPLWNRMGALLKDETYGRPFHVSIWTEQLTDLSKRTWIGQAARVGGGQLFSHGCHYIDLLLHWMGEPVSGTHVGTNVGTPWMEREGTSNVSLKFRSGATAYHFGTWGARGSRLRYAVHAHTEQGMLELDHAAGTIVQHRDPGGGDLPALQVAAEAGDAPLPAGARLVARREGAASKAVVEQMAAFLYCIEKRRKPVLSAAASLRSLQVIWRLYAAEQEGVVADLRGI